MANSRPESEITMLLRYFLVRSGHFALDDIHAMSLIETGKRDPERFKFLMGFEHNRRLLSSEPTWQGNTWVLDLLPHCPKKAVDALWAYFMAHAQFLPDYWLHGLGDAIALIRARFIEYPHPRDIFLDLSSRQFECLVRTLYEEMGYDAELTPPGNDGGRDVVASRTEPGRAEKLYVECKRWEGNVGRPELNKLFGVTQAHHATKGVLVCSSDFTSPAVEFAENLSSLELIDHKMLIELLNEHLGQTWPDKIEQYANEDDLNRLKGA